MSRHFFSNNSIQHLSFFSIQFKWQTVLFDPQIGTELVWTRERWQWRYYPHSTKFQHYWNLSIRLFNVKSRTLFGGILPLCWDDVSVFYCSSRLGWIYFVCKWSMGESVTMLERKYIYALKCKWLLKWSSPETVMLND